jgi:DNA-binding GntR family transcriptional regulator
MRLSRCIEDRVIAYDRRYLPSSIAVRLDSTLLADRPITELVDEITGNPATRSEFEVEIHPAMDEVAANLGITPGMLTVTVTATHYASETPVQVIIISYRVDRVRFKSISRASLGRH